MELYKYPRTQHIEGSRIQQGDEDLNKVPFAQIEGKFVVLEEKVDGANCGISFDSSGKLYLQSRGHFLNGGYQERQFDLFKTWAGCFQAPFYEILGSRYILYGEWLYAKHTVYYDALTHYFMEFDIFDKTKKMFLSTAKRRELLKKANFIVSVRVLYEGVIDSQESLISYLGRSAFQSLQWQKRLEQYCRQTGQNYELVQKQTDSSSYMEGIYIKVEEGDYVIDRLKYVRASFLNTIVDSQTHWNSRPIIPNQLKEGIDLFDTGEGGC